MQRSDPFDPRKSEGGDGEGITNMTNEEAVKWLNEIRDEFCAMLVVYGVTFDFVGGGIVALSKGASALRQIGAMGDKIAQLEKEMEQAKKEKKFWYEQATAKNYDDTKDW